MKDNDRDDIASNRSRASNEGESLEKKEAKDTARLGKNSRPQKDHNQNTFRVQWDGYDPSNGTYGPTSNVLSDVIDRYCNRQIGKTKGSILAHRQRQNKQRNNERSSSGKMNSSQPSNHQHCPQAK